MGMVQSLSQYSLNALFSPIVSFPSIRRSGTVRSSPQTGCSLCAVVPMVTNPGYSRFNFST